MLTHQAFRVRNILRFPTALRYINSRTLTVRNIHNTVPMPRFENLILLLQAFRHCMHCLCVLVMCICVLDATAYFIFTVETNSHSREHIMVWALNFMEYRRIHIHALPVKLKAKNSSWSQTSPHETRNWCHTWERDHMGEERRGQWTNEEERTEEEWNEEERTEKQSVTMKRRGEESWRIKRKGMRRRWEEWMGEE